MVNEPAPPSVDLQEEPSRPLPEKPTIQKAVAIQYDRSGEDAPRIIATGKGDIAERILELAFAHGVKVREDADLVEVLSKVELDSPIPAEAFTAVAEILAYVYKANAAIKERRMMPEASSGL